MLHGRGARDRHDDPRARQQPGQRHLTRRGVVLGGDPVNRTARLGKPARCDRGPGEEGDPEFLAAFEHVLGVAIGEVEAVLDRDDLDDPSGRLELLHGEVRDADAADLALVLELLERSDRLLVRNSRIRAVVLVEVDRVQTKAPRRSAPLTSGPYESAVSIRLTPSSTARRSTAMAPSWSAGGPQIPGPVIRIAPNPSRRTVRSPILIVPADSSVSAVVPSVTYSKLARQVEAVHAASSSASLSSSSARSFSPRLTCRIDQRPRSASASLAS